MNTLQKIKDQMTTEMTQERKELIKRTFCKGATDDEFRLGIATAERLGLSVEARQIFFVKRWDSTERRMVMSCQVSIDGFRLVAERSGKYNGQLGPFWCGEDGVWRDVWLSKKPPAAAKVGVLHKEFKEPLWAVATYDEYVQMTKQGVPNSMWKKMPNLMLSKCSESLALRKAFPNELSGVYTDVEISEEPTVMDEKAQHDRMQSMLTVFKDYKIDRYFLEDFCGGKNSDEFSEEDFAKCKNLFSRLRNKQITVDEVREAVYPTPIEVAETPALPDSPSIPDAEIIDPE